MRKAGSAIVLLNYPLQNQIEVGHLDLLQIQFENMLSLFDKVHIISPRDNRKYHLDWNPKIVVHVAGCSHKRTYYLSPLSDLYLILKLIKKDDVKVIRALAHSSGAIAVLASKLTNVPVIVSIHCDRKLVAEREGESKFKHWLLGLTDTWTYKNAVIIPVISKYIDVRIKEIYPNASTFLHYNFVDINQFKPQEHKNKVPVLIYVGRLAKTNGVDILLRAMPHILAKKKVALKIYGGGPERANLEKLVKILRISKQVKFFGRIDHSKGLPRELSTADLFVAPGTSGFTLIEALACGLPVVATDVDWSKEVISNDVGGLTQNDPKTLASKVINVLSNKFKTKFGENARRLALEKFSMDVWKQREREVYLNVIRS